MLRIIAGAPRTYDPMIEYWHRDELERCHCETGPAFKWCREEPQWFIHGERINCKTQAEFERIMKMKAFW